LPCGAPEVGGTEELFPNLGWVNVVPDGKATAKFEIAGIKVEFEGVGYHDKVFSISCELKESVADLQEQNWGAVPFLSVSSSWYWVSESPSTSRVSY
jgi:hypothetical protein